MKLTFFGAAKAVTGSCHCVEVRGKKILIDCGLQQGRDEIDNASLPFHPGQIDYVLVTHAHIDHSGRIPLLIKQGFQGRILTTRLTADLLDIMLQDSAHIQESDAEYKNRKNQRAGRPMEEPLYTVEDAMRVREFMDTCEYGQQIHICDGVDAVFIDAGHLLGSASIRLTLTEGGETRTIVFSGDIGNVDQPIIRNPQFFTGADYVVMESTYGDRNHTEVWSYTDDLAKIIDETIAKGGNVQIVVHVYMEDYMLGVLPYEMDNSFPLEALKAQAIAAHSYALYCRDHAAEPASGWLSVDPVRRQGYLTDAVLRSYWGTAYEENFARLSALVDSVLTDVLYYGSAPAGTSYFAISNGMTEASENVWGTALPYLVAVDSSTDLNADNYLYTVQFTTEQMQQALTGLGLLPDPAAPANWFGEAALTPSGYVASLPVCGQSVTGPALRKALGLRSACFTVQYQEGSFLLTTKGYGHGVGLSQWGAKALAEQGQSAEEILAHYFPGTELRR